MQYAIKKDRRNFYPIRREIRATPRHSPNILEFGGVNYALRKPFNTTVEQAHKPQSVSQVPDV